jgi:hypothetical protein
MVRKTVARQPSIRPRFNVVHDKVKRSPAWRALQTVGSARETSSSVRSHPGHRKALAIPLERTIPNFN